MASLSKGALRAIHTNSGQQPPASFSQPILQVLQLKQLASTGQGPVRYRIVLSDSLNFTQSMLATQNNHLVDENKLTRGCFVKLLNFTTNIMKERKVIIMFAVAIVEEMGVQEKVGDPQTLEGVPQQAQQPQPPQNRGGAVLSNGNAAANRMEKPAHIYPIEGLSPYQNKWTIKARVSLKSEIKHYHNQRGEGKLFTVHFLDQSGEIRATGFNEKVDELYEKLEEGSVYYVSKCRVNIAKKQFSSVANEYELMFDRDSEIERCNDTDDVSVPQVRFDFVNIGNVASIEKDQTIDVIGILKEVNEASEITSKATQRPYSKRDLLLVDSSGYSIKLTVWGKLAQEFNTETESVVAFKGAKVSDFGGRSLSALQSTGMTVNPSIQEAYDLKGWYDGEGRSVSFATHQSVAAGGMSSVTGRQEARKTVAELGDQNIGMSDQPDYYSCKATIMYIRQENTFYPACPSADCNKKVVEDNENGWRCERCDKSFASPQWRYVMTFSAADHTGQVWLSCFDDVGHMVMGITAEELHNLREEVNDDKAYGEKFAQAICQTFVFRCRAKQDNFNGQTRVRHSVLSATPLNYTQEANALMSLIQSY